ncbi:MAG TPA: PLP-dependent aspartate aminotransferase family protein [Candidatus Saccharimonadales bacterium]
MDDDDQVTRSVQMSSSLHFANLADYRAAGNGEPVLSGQTSNHLDNGYGLQGNPTLHQLQDSISKLENGRYSLLFPSGSTALSALSALFKSGDHWLVPDSVYAPVRRYAEYLDEHFGVKCDYYNPASLDTLADLINDKTKLIHIETPSSATFDLTDVEAVVELAKAKGVPTSADNTWASGVLYKPLDHGVDISILSLTKYIGGYSDVFMGSLTTGNEDLFKLFSYQHRVLGYTVSPFSAMLLNRGLESLEVRLAAHGANVECLVQGIEGNNKVTRIYKITPGKGNGFSGINGLFSIELDRKYSDAELEKAFAKLATFKIGESWGGTRSLVLPFQPEELSQRFNAPKNTIIRFHSGLENVDLQAADIQGFLKALQP